MLPDSLRKRTISREQDGSEGQRVSEEKKKKKKEEKKKKVE